jgi:hypothetical protein
MGSLQKNVGGQNFTFALMDVSTGLGLTGASVSAFVTLDNGTETVAGGVVTEKGNGQYNFAPSQGDTNGNNVSYLFIASGAFPTNVSLFTNVAQSQPSPAQSIWAETAWGFLLAVGICAAALIGGAHSQNIGGGGVVITPNVPEARICNGVLTLNGCIIPGMGP